MGQSSAATSQIDPAQVLQAAAALGLMGADAGAPARLMGMFCNPEVSGKDVSALIEGQPALCARVLRVANTPYYGQRRTVSTVKRATLVLGLEAVRGIAAAACIDRTVTRRSGSGLADMKALLKHSLATAIAAESVARISHGSLVSEAFIAGLVHNLGVAVQVALDRSGVEAMIAARRNDGRRGMRELEAESCNVGHEDCAAIVFDAWKLPESLVAAVANHHAPLQAPAAHRDLAALVSLGAEIGLACGHGFSLEREPVEGESAGARLLGMDPEQLALLTADLAPRIENLQSALLSG
jgi:HD-like signal output (HDOD) protein